MKNKGPLKTLKDNNRKDDEPTLFVWRGSELVTASISLQLSRDICPFCAAPLHHYWNYDNKGYANSCKLCGWHIKDIKQYCVGGSPEYATAVRYLDAFTISSSDLALHELGSHLKRKFSDIYLLNPYRFEELIGDIFRNIGYTVELTKKSCDGGVDLFILSGGAHRLGIIQCKRYKKEKKIGIELVDRLIGTAVAFDTRKALLVTTSAFTQQAMTRAMLPSLIKQGFQIELLDAYDILRFLDVYNTELPPLDKLPPDFLLKRGLV